MNFESDHYALVANGEINDLQAFEKAIYKYSVIIAVDGGMKHLLDINCTPTLIVGDLDSAPKEALEKFQAVEKFTAPCDKDESDLELAIDLALKRGAKTITVYGALGGRQDHTIANLLLLAKKPGCIFFETESECWQAISKKTTLYFPIGQTLSFFALGENAEGVTTKGLKWDLDNNAINTTFFSLSNVCIANDVTIDVTKGTLFLGVQKGLLSPL